LSLDASAIEMVQNALIITLKVTAPILAAGVLVGLIVSILQAVTSIQDQTVAIVPKIVVMLVVALLLAGWIFLRVSEYAAELFTLKV
jgi:flagellar biosynthetic protein FliQ